MKNEKKILIIEDEHYLAEMYKMKLEFAGYKVYIADDGYEGVAAAKKELPDLILLDIVMPGMNGYKVLETLQQDPKTSGLKVVVFSNLGQADEIKQAMKDGAMKYLIKANLTPNQLLEEIEKVLGI